LGQGNSGSIKKRRTRERVGSALGRVERQLYPKLFALIISKAGKDATFQLNLRLPLFPMLRQRFQFQPLRHWMGKANLGLLPKSLSYLPFLWYLLLCRH
jgi:hypothetical protein